MKKFKIVKKLIGKKVKFRIKEKKYVSPEYSFFGKITKDGYYKWKKVKGGKWYTTGWDGYSYQLPVNFKSKRKARKYIKNLKYK